MAEETVVTVETPTDDDTDAPDVVDTGDTIIITGTDDSGNATDIDHEGRIVALEEWRGIVDAALLIAVETAANAETTADLALDEALTPPVEEVVETPEEPDTEPVKVHFLHRSFHEIRHGGE